MFRSLSARWHPFSPFESEFCTLNASLPTLRPKGRTLLKGVSEHRKLVFICTSLLRRFSSQNDRFGEGDGRPDAGWHEPRQGLRT
jgi:hypothetical protein